MMNRMFKAALAIGLGTLSVALPPPAAAAPVATWHGNYVWEESLGRVGGSMPSEGVAAFVTYKLALGRGRSSTGCRLDIEGYQTYRHILCTATPQGSAIIIKFYRLGRDGRGQSYAPGTPLFTLTRAGGGVVTRLDALYPVGDATPRRGRLFRRVG